MANASSRPGFWQTKAGLVAGALLCNFLWGSAIPVVVWSFTLPVFGVLLSLILLGD